jgi:hypothetical protein
LFILAHGPWAHDLSRLKLLKLWFLGSNIHHVMLELPSYVHFPWKYHVNDYKDEGNMIGFAVACSCQKYAYYFGTILVT